MQDDQDDQGHSPAIAIVIAWVGEHGTSWEYDSHSSNRIKLTFEEAGLSYTATATEDEPVCLTLRVSLPIAQVADELRVHRTLATLSFERLNGAVFYLHDRAELVWRATFALGDEDFDEIAMGVKTTDAMIEEAVATFDVVRKRLADLLHHTGVQADLSLMPAHGRA
ncbi:MAG: hypothetical protein MUF19_01415 [Candidatus Pacebacteria bacterium]|jgi:hypothetical protein|nr:hypothetical protein [Candidatus Paceibacterota bacterium]